MIEVNFSSARSRFKELCDMAADGGETVLVAGENGKNAVIISEERYKELEKTERNDAYIRKIERGLAQVDVGLGIVKTMDELEAMGEGGV